MAGKRLQKRKKKQGAALFVSRLIRLGMLAVLLVCLWLAVLGARACAGWLGTLRTETPAGQEAQSVPDVSLPPE